MAERGKPFHDYLKYTPVSMYSILIKHRTFLPSYTKLETRQFDIYAYVDTVLGRKLFGHVQRLVGGSPRGGFGGGAQKLAILLDFYYFL